MAHEPPERTSPPKDAEPSELLLPTPPPSQSSSPPPPDTHISSTPPHTHSDVRRCVQRLAVDALNDGMAAASNPNSQVDDQPHSSTQWIFDEIHHVEDLGTLDFPISDTLLNFADTEYVHFHHQNHNQQMQNQSNPDSPHKPSLPHSAADVASLPPIPAAPSTTLTTTTTNTRRPNTTRLDIASLAHHDTENAPRQSTLPTSVLTSSPGPPNDNEHRHPKRPRTRQPVSHVDLTLTQRNASHLASTPESPTQRPAENAQMEDNAHEPSQPPRDKMQHHQLKHEPHQNHPQQQAPLGHATDKAKLVQTPAHPGPDPLDMKQRETVTPAKDPPVSKCSIPITLVKVGCNGLAPKLPAAKLQQHPVLGRLQLQPEHSGVDHPEPNKEDTQASSPPPESNGIKASKEPTSPKPSGVKPSSSKVRSKKRLVWNSELHARFVAAVKSVGLNAAVPKTIVQLMNVDGLTTEHVKSHLQKYRSSLRKGFSDDAAVASTGGCSNAMSSREHPAACDATWALRPTVAENKLSAPDKPGDGNCAGYEMQKQIEKQIEMQDRTIQLQLQMQIMVHRTISMQRRLNMSLQRQSGKMGVGSGGTSVSGDGEEASDRGPLVQEHLVLLNEQKAMQTELEQQQALLKQQMDDQERVRQLLIRDAGL